MEPHQETSEGSDISACTPACWDRMLTQLKIPGEEAATRPVFLCMWDLGAQRALCHMSNRKGRKLSQLFTKERRPRGLNQPGADKERLKTRAGAAPSAAIVSQRPIIFNQQ